MICKRCASDVNLATLNTCDADPDAPPLAQILPFITSSSASQLCEPFILTPELLRDIKAAAIARGLDVGDIQLVAMDLQG